jgi:hypothetical protein
MRHLLLFVIVVTLTACSSYITSRYSINVDTNIALRDIGLNGISVGPIKGPAEYASVCRLSGVYPMSVIMPDGMSVGEYFKKALIDELKQAWMYVEQPARINITGVINQAEFSSGMVNASWNISVTLFSSNGKTMNASERYEFKGSFDNDSSCFNVANAFMPAMQNLIQKIVQSPEFKNLLI